MAEYSREDLRYYFILQTTDEKDRDSRDLRQDIFAGPVLMTHPCDVLGRWESASQD